MPKRLQVQGNILKEECYTELTKTKSKKLRVWVKGGTPGEKYVVIALRESRKHGHGPKQLVNEGGFTYGKKLAGERVYPEDTGVDTLFPQVPYWMEPYQYDANRYDYGVWTVTISEKYKNGFVDIDLGKFLLPFLRPADEFGVKYTNWRYSDNESNTCFARFIGEGKKNAPIVFRFVALPYNFYYTASNPLKHILNYMSDTSSNILKIGSRVRPAKVYGEYKNVRRLDVKIDTDENGNLTSASITPGSLYVSII